MIDIETTDRIHIRDLEVRTVIGIHPDERDIRQTLVLNITLFTDQRRAAETDDFELTVDYQAAERSVIDFAESTSFELIEALAQAVADLLLAMEGVLACRVVLDKPGVLERARSAAVEIFREAD